MAKIYPVIYIRGYAMNESERDDTTADPFCGFNIGSTLYRANIDKNVRPDKFIFESPFVRLISEYGYKHVYQDGKDIMDNDWHPGVDNNGNPLKGIPMNSIAVFRYYDSGSDYFGNGKSKTIIDYAEELFELIKRIKSLVVENNNGTDPGFHCYLVAHSMGGLIARAFLQSVDPTYREMISSVDKLFTIATPHNGIDMAGKNVPFWLSAEQINTFNSENLVNMMNISDISPAFEDRADLIRSETFPVDKIFCMVGSNRCDYEVLAGAVRAFVGAGSDGLVRIDNASLWSIAPDMKATPVATAFAYRSHSGHFGIVNSEETYQNLVRFLFGDVRVDIYAAIDSVSLPAELQSRESQVRALYQMELLASPKGKRWFLTRRTAIEDSPVCRTHQELTSAPGEEIYLSSVFLSKRGKVDQDSEGLSYFMTFAIKTPDYEVDKKFWPNGHYEGANLFSDTAIIHVFPSKDDAAPWLIEMKWNNDPTVWQVPVYFNAALKMVKLELPFSANSKPGVRGRIVLHVRPWE